MRYKLGGNFHNPFAQSKVSIQALHRSPTFQLKKVQQKDKKTWIGISWHKKANQLKNLLNYLINRKKFTSLKQEQNDTQPMRLSKKFVVQQ